MPLIYLSCAWMVGIFLGAIFNLPLTLIFIGLIPLPLLFWFHHRRMIILISLCVIALFGGAFCFQSSLPPSDEHSLQFYNDQETVTIKGIINTDPEVREKTIHLHLSATDIKLDEEWQKVSGTALLFVPRYPTYEYGDVLLMTGKLETPPQLDDFNYKDCVVTISSSIMGITPVISTLLPSSHTLILSMSSARRLVSKSSVASF